MLEIIKNLFIERVLAAQAIPKITSPTGLSESFKSFSSIETAIPVIFNLIIIVSGITFVILLFIGGLQYLFSAGNSEGTTKARKWLIDAIIGLIVVVGAWAIGTWILSVFGLLK